MTRLEKLTELLEIFHGEFCSDKHYYYFCDFIKELIDEEKIIMKWVSIFDKLPSPGKKVLLYSEEKGPFWGWRETKENWSPRKILWYSEHFGYIDNDEYIYPDDKFVTHWMELPEFPNERKAS